MAARRESDVLLTEGHDATWALPGPEQRHVRHLGRQPDGHRLRRLGGERPAGRDDQRRQPVHRLQRADGRDRDRLGRHHDHPDLPEGGARARGRVLLHHLRHELAGVGRRQQVDHEHALPGDGHLRRAWGATGRPTPRSRTRRRTIGAHQGQVRHRGRQGDRPLRQDQVHRRDRQAHERRPLPPVQGRRLRDVRHPRLQEREELLLHRQLDGATSSATPASSPGRTASRATSGSRSTTSPTTTGT